MVFATLARLIYLISTMEWTTFKRMLSADIRGLSLAYTQLINALIVNVSFAIINIMASIPLNTNLI